VTQRGNGRQDVFRCDEDRRLYLDLYRRYTTRYGVTTWGFCLMSNHVHLLAVPEREDSLARSLGRTHSDYARYFNVRHGSSGHLWESRFFSCPLGGDHTWAALRYVERNPVSASMVSRAEDWRWSSARAHIHDSDPDALLVMDPWRAAFFRDDWRSELDGPADELSARRLREATMCGRPFGDREFVERLEHAVGRRLTPRPVGRPRKHAETAAREELAQLEIGI
jgi:putative transposase